MHWGLVKTIIVLPGTVLVFVPAVTLLATRDSKFAPKLASSAQVWFWMALLAAGIGLALSVWTATLFMKFGGGTPAPWNPPKRLVIRGPYRHVRNPMITGVLLVLFAEAILLRSWPIAAWMMVFFIGNAIYFPFVEIGSPCGVNFVLKAITQSLNRLIFGCYRNFRQLQQNW